MKRYFRVGSSNKANSLGRQKSPFLRRSAFLPPVICDVMVEGE